MAYRLSTFGADRTGFWVIESRHGIAAKGEPATVHRVKVFPDQPARDAYMAQRGYI
jgi:hypothetical protein